jgi:hypothetical protein
MGQPEAKYVEVKMTAYLKSRLVDAALRDRYTLNDWVVRLICRELGEEPTAGLVPPKQSGRKPVRFKAPKPQH